jgi:hypothetical protein
MPFMEISHGNPDLLTIFGNPEIWLCACALQSRAESDYQLEVNKRGVQDLFADILYNQDVRSSGDETNKRKEGEEEESDEEEEEEKEGREQQEEEEREAEVAASTRKMAQVKSSRFSRSSDSFR